MEALINIFQVQQLDTGHVLILCIFFRLALRLSADLGTSAK
jgi:hypothetical protein